MVDEVVVEFGNDILYYRNVWSAAGLQAKTDSGKLVCSNVVGLQWSQRPLAMMDSARSLPY
jgi:hypothetical protein